MGSYQAPTDGVVLVEGYTLDLTAMLVTDTELKFMIGWALWDAKVLLFPQTYRCVMYPRSVFTL